MGVEMELALVFVLGFVLGRYLRYSVLDFVIRLFGKKLKEDMFVRNKFFEMMDDLKKKLDTKDDY